MSDCKCNEQHDNFGHVPDFTKEGAEHSVVKSEQVYTDMLNKDVLALKLSVCVSASYDPSTKQICFDIPIYGRFCVTSPIAIPIGGNIKACAQTCGSFIPTGLKVTIYLDDKPIFTVVLWGAC